jgi:hypothetical protein
MGDYVPNAPIDEEAKKRNGNLPGMGGVFNYVNMHMYHYAGNNPVKYTDPDGNDLILVVHKSRGEMNVIRTPTYNQGTPVSQDMGVVTSVVKDSPGHNAIASDTRRTQKTGEGLTNPSQMPAGTYPLIKARAPSTGEGKYGSDDLGLDIGFSQILQGVDATNMPIEGLTLKDDGYMIHITPYGNTNGCIGIKYDEKVEGSREAAEAKMRYIVDQYKEAINNGEQAKIIIME